MFRAFQYNQLETVLFEDEIRPKRASYVKPQFNALGNTLKTNMPYIFGLVIFSILRDITVDCVNLDLMKSVHA